MFVTLSNSSQNKMDAVVEDAHKGGCRRHLTSWSCKASNSTRNPLRTNFSRTLWDNHQILLITCLSIIKYGLKPDRCEKMLPLLRFRMISESSQHGVCLLGKSFPQPVGVFHVEPLNCHIANSCLSQDVRKLMFGTFPRQFYFMNEAHKQYSLLGTLLNSIFYLGPPRKHL